jgi:hypothetical protein
MHAMCMHACKRCPCLLKAVGVAACALLTQGGTARSNSGHPLFSSLPAPPTLCVVPHVFMQMVVTFVSNAEPG